MKKPAKSTRRKTPSAAAIVRPPPAPAAGPGRRGARRRFPIVGIGASAGGLEALEQFLKNVPAGSGMAFVIVQHLDPTHKGILAELLQRVTPMKVSQVKNRTRVRPDHVYVIPPNTDLSLRRGVLHLLVPVLPRGLRLPIDFFFRSLADDAEERSVGVILSGMGSDGTLGLKAIKGKAGVVFVQDPASAKFNGMPHSAVESGLADIIAPVEALPGKIVAYLQHPPLLVRPGLAEEDKGHSAFERIVLLLRAQTGHDFSRYKKNTVYRRIERRMGIHQIDQIAAYVRFLQENSQELELLFKELLIGVTSFFRDPAAWEQLKAEVLPALLKDRPPTQALRIWVPGCATGEEAYSLAILFKEALSQLKPARKPMLQIFATDLDRDAIAKARAGIFPASIAADVSAERLDEFFIPAERGYQVKSIREMVIFALQNLVMDPPFTRLDLVSCRNLLIYLTPELQKKLFPLFHYSLNPGGVLFLGNAETVGGFTHLFAPLAGRTQFYRRLESGLRAEPVEFPTSFTPAPPKAAPLPQPLKPTANLQLSAEQLLLQRYSPAAVLVNDKGDILFINGRTGKYLEPVAGKANWNLFAMAREGLAYELTDAVRKALRQPDAVTRKNLKVETDAGGQTVDLTVQAIAEPAALRGLVMIVFKDVATPSKTKESAAKGRSAGSARLAALERNIEQAHQELQTTREEMQTSQEEAKSANEELQSANEEMQSTNEELTTSTEEMQSMNEELQTLGTEMQRKVEELSRFNNDMKNLLNNTDVGILFLDSALRVRLFTDGANRVFKLIPGDVGRPITNIVSELDYPALADNMRAVLRTLAVHEQPVAASDGRRFYLRIMPYRTMENMIDGVILTLVDITKIGRAEEALLASGERLQKLFVEAPLGVALIDSLTGQIHEVNRMFAKIAGRTMEEMLSIDWMSITHPDDVQKDLDNMALLNAGKIDRFQMEKRYLHRDGTAVWINMTVAPVKVADKAHPRHLCMIEDITERKQGAEALRKANDLLRLVVVVRDSRDAITVQDLAGRIIAWNPGAVRMYGWSEAEALKMNVLDRIPEGLRKDALAKLHQLGKAEILEPYRTQRLKQDGTVEEVSIISTALVDEAGQLYAIATTERMKARPERGDP